MTADYVAPSPPPPPPPSEPPPHTPPPPPPPTPEQAETFQQLATTPQANADGEVRVAPTPTRVTLQAKRLFMTHTSQGDIAGSKEVVVSMEAVPDPNQPASKSMDRLWQAVHAKLDQYMQELG